MKAEQDVLVYIKFLRDRVSELRIESGVSESRMSEELNYSKGYIQSITSGRSLPSIEGFLNICNYFSVTPKGFWETCGGTEEDKMILRLVAYARELPAEKCNMLIMIAMGMSRSSYDFRL